MDLEKLASIFEACRVLPLHETDLLVFRSPHILDMEQMAHIHGHLEELTGHPRILILTEGADLAVLRPEAEPEVADAQPAEVIHRPIAPKRGSAPGAIS